MIGRIKVVAVVTGGCMAHELIDVVIFGAAIQGSSTVLLIQVLVKLKKSVLEPYHEGTATKNII